MSNGTLLIAEWMNSFRETLNLGIFDLPISEKLTLIFLMPPCRWLNEAILVFAVSVPFRCALTLEEPIATKLSLGRPPSRGIIR